MLIPITAFRAYWTPKLLGDGGISMLGGGFRYYSTCSAISEFSWSSQATWFQLKRPSNIPLWKLYVVFVKL